MSEHRMTPNTPLTEGEEVLTSFRADRATYVRSNTWMTVAAMGGVSLALDGVIYRDAWFTEINEDSEVVLMPYMAGG